MGVGWLRPLGVSLLFSKQLALGGRVRLCSGVFVAFKEEQNAVLLIHDRCGSLIGSRARASSPFSVPPAHDRHAARAAGSAGAARCGECAAGSAGAAR